MEDKQKNSSDSISKDADKTISDLREMRKILEENIAAFKIPLPKELSANLELDENKMKEDIISGKLSSTKAFLLGLEKYNEIERFLEKESLKKAAKSHSESVDNIISEFRKLHNMLEENKDKVDKLQIKGLSSLSELTEDKLKKRLSSGSLLERMEANRTLLKTTEKALNSLNLASKERKQGKRVARIKIMFLRVERILISFLVGVLKRVRSFILMFSGKNGEE